MTLQTNVIIKISVCVCVCVRACVCVFVFVFVFVCVCVYNLLGNGKAIQRVYLVGCWMSRWMGDE